MRTKNEIQKRIDADKEWLKTGKCTLEGIAVIKNEIDVLEWVLR